MKGKLRRMAAMALSVLMCAAALFLVRPAEASAASYNGLDTSKPCSLSLSYHPDHGDRDGITFRMYRIGDMDDAARLSFTDDWKDIPVTMQNLDAEGWARLAATLAGYIDNDKDIDAASSGRTDSRGDVKFSDVRAGVYVLIGDSHSVRVENRDGSVTTYRYEPRPEMVILPYLGTNGWVQDRVISAIKFEVTNTTEEPTVDRRVMKVWNDSGNASERPSSIEVALVQDGRVREVVTLDRWNNWRHDWEDLPADSTYRVVELTRPLNYYVTSWRNGTTFVLENTYVEPETPPPYVPPTPPVTPPSTPDVPEPSVPSTPPTIVVVPPDTPTEIPEEPTPLTPWIIVNNPDPTTELPDPDVPLEEMEESEVPLEDLPQTGQLWWPVPVLAGLAVLCFGVGVALLRKKD